MTTPPTVPAAFIGHGSPMNTLSTSRWSEAWADLAHRFPRPRAILAISAHWYINATAVTAMDHPRTIHDFFGFPPELFAYQYPAPGSPELAHQVVELVAPTWIGKDLDSWGLDHGTWSILAHMYPEADIPVVQLSVDASKPAPYHLELGAALEPLRRDGVLILASGNVVHNLRAMDRARPDGGAPWAQEFDQAATALMVDQPSRITDLLDHPHHLQASPTPDHLLPLFYVAGVAQAAGQGAEVLIEGCVMGSLSMTSYQVPAA